MPSSLMNRLRWKRQTLDRLFGLSRRLWYLVLPCLGYLPSAVEKHLDLVEAVQVGDADRAEQIMREHVGEFYARVRETLAHLDGNRLPG